MQNKLYIADERMLELSEILQQKGVIRFKQEMWDAIGIKKQTISNIKVNIQHFTVKQIEMACRIYAVNANWIFGLSDTVFRRIPISNSSQTKTTEKN